MPSENAMTRDELLLELQTLRRRNQQLEAMVQQQPATTVPDSTGDCASIQLNLQNEYFHALHETALGILDRLDTHELLEAILAHATKLVGTPHGYIYTVNAEQGHLDLKVSVGVVPGVHNYTRNLGDGVAGKVWESGKPLLVENYDTWPHRIANALRSDAKAIIGIPLKSGEQILGVLGLIFTTETQSLYNEKTIAILYHFTELAAIALDNARLYSDVQKELEERRALVQALRKSEIKNRAILSALPDSIFVLNRAGVCIDVGGAEIPHLTMPARDFVGKAMLLTSTPEARKAFLHHLEILFDTGEMQIFEYATPRDHKIVYREARLVLCGDDEALLILRDITDRKEMEQELQYLSLHDPLTKLHNRAFFEREIERRKGRQDSIGVIVCDVDGLKLVNDTFGHDAGDELLLAAAKVITKSLRSGDTVARVGGDEFVIILPGSNAEATERVCRRLMEEVAIYNEGNPTYALSISVGFAHDVGMGRSTLDLFREADNNMYREKLHQSKSARSAIVQTLMKALEMRDFVTEGHADRLQDMVAVVGKAAKLPDQRLTDLRLLAQFHDIGKVGVPDHILFKPGALTPEERTIMETHAEIGYRIAQSSPDLAPISGWILRHHEWWNGGGYPLGLKGEEIPLECRILAIADAYDAMTSDRPYRKAMPHHAAMQLLKDEAGAQFDPALVEIFVQILA